MSGRIKLPLFIAAMLLPRAAFAAGSTVAPPGGGLPALAVSVDLSAGRVQVQSCAPGQASCAVTAQSATEPIAVDRASLPTPGEVSAEVVPIGAGKHAVHVRIPLLGTTDASGPAWEGLFVAGGPPLFAGTTGWTRGEPGERTGQALVFLPNGAARSAVRGDIQEDLRICGEPATLLRPQGLDPQLLAWRGATLQRLPETRLDKAVAVVAGLRGGAPPDAPVAQLLTPQGASTAIGSPKAAADGDPESTWSEARPGQGQGEFVLFRAPHDVPITRFTLVVAPHKPRPTGAAPRTFYLATDAALFEVTMPEDAWMHPGAAYDVPLPDPVKTSCVALVLDEAYAQGKPAPEVTIAELVAYSEFDAPGAGVAALAGALSGGGLRAEAAAGLLKRAGPAGLAAARDAYAKLDGAGRALAVDVAASSTKCADSASLLVRALADPDEVVREKARAKLEQPHCGKDAVPALVAALGAGETRVPAARLLASVSPTSALQPLAKVLGTGTARERAELRSSFAHAAEHAAPQDLSALLDEPRELDARVELLRASEERLGELRGSADRALGELLAGTPALRTRYLLAGPIAALAHAGDPKGDELLVGMLSRDGDAVVRVRAAELAGASPATQAALDRAALDPDPRVRAAALRTVSVSRVASAERGATAALGRDAWSFVRLEAAGALAALPASASADEALARAARDKAPRVRAAAIDALGRHGAADRSALVRDRMNDAKEDGEVRATAARALGSLCDARAVDDLVRYALAGASSPEENDVALGLAATEALGHIHPADLASRLKNIHSKGARPDAMRAADAAVAGPGTCARGVASPGR